MFDIMCHHFKSNRENKRVYDACVLTEKNKNNTKYTFNDFMKDMNICFVIYNLDKSRLFLKIIDRIGSSCDNATKIGVLNIPKTSKNLLMLSCTNETAGTKDYFYDMDKCITNIIFKKIKRISIINHALNKPNITDIINIYYEYIKKHNPLSIYKNNKNLKKKLKHHNIEIYLFSINLENDGIENYKIIGSCQHTSTKIMIFNKMTTSENKNVQYIYSLIVYGIKGHEVEGKKTLNKKDKNVHTITLLTV